MKPDSDSPECDKGYSGAQDSEWFIAIMIKIFLFNRWDKGIDMQGYCPGGISAQAAWTASIWKGH